MHIAWLIIARVVGARVVLVVFCLFVSASWALAGVSGDGSVAQRLVVMKRDAIPLFPGDLTSLDIHPCPMPTVAGDAVTATASGDWGGVDHGLWSTATVVSTQAGADRLYDRVITSLPGCLLRWAKSWGLAAYRGYKTQLCKWASLRPLPSKRYGGRSRAFRAEYSQRWRYGCTVRALDGFAVQTQRAVTLYVFDNANVKGRHSSSVTAQDEALVGRATARAARSS